jgi:hypothetical protein
MKGQDAGNGRTHAWIIIGHLGTAMLSQGVAIINAALEPDGFILNLIYQMPGLNTLSEIVRKGDPLTDGPFRETILKC